MHLFERLQLAKSQLAPVQSQYRVVWEDPDRPDDPACITVPDPNWLAAALAGGVLPPVDTYLRDQERAPGERMEHPYADPIGPLTEEEAIEYLIQKDIPPRVWRDYRGNRVIMRIVPVWMIPSDRSYRNAWKVSQDPQPQEEAA